MLTTSRCRNYLQMLLSNPKQTTSILHTPLQKDYLEILETITSNLSMSMETKICFCVGGGGRLDCSMRRQ